MVRTSRILATVVAAGALFTAPATAAFATSSYDALERGLLMASIEPAPDLDGFRIAHLPAGTGPQVSDFETEWEDVRFHSRVWESEADGGFQVDLTMKTLRGDGLTDAEAVKMFLAEYHEGDDGEWDPQPVQVGPYQGFRTGDQVFWFVETGVAAAVTLDLGRFGEPELTATADGFRPAD
jgi:hypothetical protein